MALLPESCWSRDLASYCGGEKVRSAALCAADPRILVGQATRVPKPRQQGRQSASACCLQAQGGPPHLSIHLPPEEHVRGDGFGSCKFLPCFARLQARAPALHFPPVGDSEGWIWDNGSDSPTASREVSLEHCDPMTTRGPPGALPTVPPDCSSRPGPLSTLRPRHREPLFPSLCSMETGWRGQGFCPKPRG